MRLLSTISLLILILVLYTLPACDKKSGDSSSDDDTTNVDDDNNDDDDDLPKPCADIYAQDILPTFEIEISQENWEKLVYEYEHWQELEEQGLPIKNYYPLESFRYEDEVIHDAMIRLKGSPYGWDVPKMQFVISFNEINPNGRFHGLRKLNLDASDNDLSQLRYRLALSFFHDLGVPAPCANNVRLVINGEYYGLYTNLERVDKEFLQRNFGKYDDGNLYKYNELKTNEDIGDTSDMEEFMSNPDLDTLEDILDMEESLLEWAGEAVIPQADGFFVGGINYYMYNHPKRGFIFIPWDLDYSFEEAPVNADLITFEVDFGLGKPPQFLTVVLSEKWYPKYLEAIEKALLAYDVETLQSRLDQWAEQIADAIIEDPNKHFTYEEHVNAIQGLRQYIEDRAYFVALWLNCKRGEGNYEIVELGDEQYYFWFTQCNWQNALDHCKSMGGTLAVPADETEQSFFVSKAFELSPEDWWIGANDIQQEGIWSDPDGNVLTYLPWATGQPNGGKNQNCAVIDYASGGFWNDKYCDDVFPSICKLSNDK